MTQLPEPQLQPIFLAGPTAVGKSEIALRLAELIKGEIISVDSMQVYRGLDLGTAKPSPTERRCVPHHLIDVAELTEPFDAAQFTKLAQAAVSEIQARGGAPIFCGGTGLYFKAFLEGLGEAPPADPALRAELERTPLSELLQELERGDPATHAKIDIQNPRRVIRAIEVIRLTGKAFSAQRADWQPVISPAQPPLPFFAFARQAPNLQTRINQRVDAMFRNGLVRETEELLQRGLEANRTAMQAIGYRQVVEHLRGERPLAETIELVKVRTRQFSKRQMTWFRRQAPATWIELAAESRPAEMARQIASGLRPNV